jgi:hypothetical protein
MTLTPVLEDPIKLTTPTFNRGSHASSRQTESKAGRAIHQLIPPEVVKNNGTFLITPSTLEKRQRSSPLEPLPSGSHHRVPHPDYYRAVKQQQDLSCGLFVSVVRGGRLLGEIVRAKRSAPGHGRLGLSERR